MAGQDAVNAATAFSDALPLTGVILTKADGDAKGGVALSVREITGQPIRFLGVGEKVDGLEAFHPERMASRILGMGDVLTGIIAALIAQGADLERAATAGVEIHARAGDRAAVAGERGLMASDLLAELRNIVNP